jgi:hypothetical protein
MVSARAVHAPILSLSKAASSSDSRTGEKDLCRTTWLFGRPREPAGAVGGFVAVPPLVRARRRSAPLCGPPSAAEARVSGDIFPGPWAGSESSLNSMRIVPTISSISPS